MSDGKFDFLFEGIPPPRRSLLNELLDAAEPPSLSALDRARQRWRMRLEGEDPHEPE